MSDAADRLTVQFTSPTPGETDPARVNEKIHQLTPLDEQAYLRAVLRYLDRPEPGDEDVFRGDELRQRTRAAVGALLAMADKQDRSGYPDEHRAKWRAVRTAARAERDAIKALPPIGAGPRRRALERLGREHPDELAALRAAHPARNANRVVLEQLAGRHPVRMIELLREERARQRARS